jgi:dimethylargininase
MTPGLSYLFSHVLCRMPGDSIAKGLRAGEGADPDPARFRLQHRAYQQALAKAGADVICLPALEDYPDSVFVEDPALTLPEGAILLRPGAESRAGEVADMRSALEPFFSAVKALEGPGFVDGGDIMVTSREILVGRSARTNEEGFEELAAILKGWGYQSRLVETPPSILHLKTGSSIMDDDLILCTPTMAQSGLFDGYDLIETAPGEEAAANAIRINDTILLSAGHPGTAERMRNVLPELDVVELDTSQAALVDAGLSCMSLRFRLA